jgi:hypothetical protein
MTISCPRRHRRPSIRIFELQANEALESADFDRAAFQARAVALISPPDFENLLRIAMRLRFQRASAGFTGCPVVRELFFGNQWQNERPRSAKVRGLDQQDGYFGITCDRLMLWMLNLAGTRIGSLGSSSFGWALIAGLPA